jgi:hypothetical protein
LHASYFSDERLCPVPAIPVHRLQRLIRRRYFIPYGALFQQGNPLIFYVDKNNIAASGAGMVF